MKSRFIFILVAFVAIIICLKLTSYDEDLLPEELTSNILDDAEKRTAAESFLFETLQQSFQNSTVMLYYDSLVVRVNDEQTNFYIERQLVSDIDPQKDPAETEDLYLNHFYAIRAEYNAEYAPDEFSYVEGMEGIFHITTDYYVIEKDIGWEIEDNQFRGAIPVSSH